jgi:hypothetical protein
VAIFGWDMSHYDAPGLGSAAADGISFITHKAGGDNSSGDPELAPWWTGAKRLDPARYLLGTYWVPRPDLHPSPAGTADDWIATLDARCPGWHDREHILQIDAERWPAGDQTKPSRAYIQALGNRLLSRASKLRPICYASRGQYGNSLAGLTFPLWNANYPSNAALGFKAAYARAGGDSGPGWVKYSGQVPAIWQYTSAAVIGGQTTSDANAFRGTLAQLKALIAPGWQEESLVTTQAEFNTLMNGWTATDQAKKFIRAWLELDMGKPGGSNYGQAIQNTEATVRDVAAEVAEIQAAGVQVDVAALAAALAPLLPGGTGSTAPEIARQVAAELAARLQA